MRQNCFGACTSLWTTSCKRSSRTVLRKRWCGPSSSVVSRTIPLMRWWAKQKKTNLDTSKIGASGATLRNINNFYCIPEVPNLTETKILPLPFLTNPSSFLSSSMINRKSECSRVINWHFNVVLTSNSSTRWLQSTKHCCRLNPPPSSSASSWSTPLTTRSIISLRRIKFKTRHRRSTFRNQIPFLRRNPADAARWCDSVDATRDCAIYRLYYDWT